MKNLQIIIETEKGKTLDNAVLIADKNFEYIDEIDRNNVNLVDIQTLEEGIELMIQERGEKGMRWFQAYTGGHVLHHGKVIAKVAYNGKVFMGYNFEIEVDPKYYTTLINLF